MKPDARIRDIIETLADPEEYVRGIVGNFVQHSFDKERPQSPSALLGPAFTPIISSKSPVRLSPDDEGWFSTVEVIEKS